VAGEALRVDGFEAAQLSAARVALGIAGISVAIAWERARPLGRRAGVDWRHEASNLALWALNAALLRLVGATVLFGATFWSVAERWGLLHRLDAPVWLELLVTVVVLDAVTYLIHRLYHARPLLWRVHRVHHSDADVAATTGVRFHAFEVILSAVLRLPVVVFLGAEPLGVAAFEAWLLLASQLQHADARLPDRVDALVRRVLVTPNVHRIHHSKVRREADSNYGTIFTCWDHLFGTFRVDPAPEQIRPGLPDAPDSAWSFLALLWMPFPGVRSGR